MASTTPIAKVRRSVGLNFGKCVDFNQASSAISFITPVPLQSSSVDYTFMTYFNARVIDATSRRIIDQSNQGLLIIITTNGIQIQARHASTNGQIIIPISVVTKGEFHDLIVKWSDSMNFPLVKFDGQLYASSPTNKSGARLGALSPTYVGNRSAADRTFNGTMDKHAWFARLTTEAEDMAYHQQGIIPSGASLAYEMEELSGNLADSSGNVVTGTPSNISQGVTSLVIPSRSQAVGRVRAVGRVAV